MPKNIKQNSQSYDPSIIAFFKQLKVKKQINMILQRNEMGWLKYSYHFAPIGRWPWAPIIRHSSINSPNTKITITTGNMIATIVTVWLSEN